jgi:hypothetical protein
VAKGRDKIVIVTKASHNELVRNSFFLYACLVAIHFLGFGNKEWVCR